MGKKKRKERGKYEKEKEASREERRKANLIHTESEVVSGDLPVLEATGHISYQVLIVQVVVLVKILLKALLVRIEHWLLLRHRLQELVLAFKGS